MVDVPELAKRSWALFQSKPVEHIVVSLLAVVLSVITLGVLLGPLSVGQIRMIEKQQRGDDLRIGDVFDGFSSFGAAFLTSLVFCVALAIGMMFLVLPGVFVGAAWGFALWFVALEGASVSDALAGSWQLLKRHTLSVLVVFLILAALNAVASAVVLGLVLTTPLSMIFATLAFQELIGLDPDAPRPWPSKPAPVVE
jgi:hypothetical protein